MKSRIPVHLKKVQLITAMVTAFLFTSILVFGNYADDPKEKINFELEDINGKVWKSENLKGSVIVFNFWFTACPPCKKEIPELNELVEKYENKGVVFIGVSLDGADDVEEFTYMHPFKYNLIPDGADFIDGNHVSSFPTQFIIDKDGNLVKRMVGGVTFEEMKKQLDVILTK